MKILTRYAIQGLAIMGFYGIGYCLSLLMGGVLPGSVIGMLLLFVGLWSGIIKKEWVKEVAEFLIRNMVVFFIPPCIGIMVSWSSLDGQLWAVLVTMVVSTVAVIAAVGVTEQMLERRKK